MKNNFYRTSRILAALVSSLLLAACDKKVEAPKDLVSADPALPPQASDLPGYFAGTGNESGPDDSQNPEEIYPFRHTAAGVVGDCLQYSALAGNYQVQRRGASSLPERVSTRTACAFLQHWDRENTQLPIPSDAAIRNVRQALQTCTPENHGYLVVDLKSNYQDINSAYAQISIESGVPFSAFTYCVTPSMIYALNPQELQYEILNPSELAYVQRRSEAAGWFEGAFVNYDADGNISPALSTIRLARNQGRAGQEQITIHSIYSQLPGVRVLVRPEGRHAADPFTRMNVRLTDAHQRLIRNETVVNGVVPSSGELSISHMDLDYKVDYSKLNLSQVRSYSSFYNHIEDFGRNWSMFPKRLFYRLASVAFDEPLSTIRQFISTGDARVFFLPSNFDGGVSDNALMFFRPSEEAIRPVMTKTKLFKDNGFRYFDLSGRWMGETDLTPSYDSTGVQKLNSSFAIYDGNQIVLLMDQLAQSNSAENIQVILHRFKSLNATNAASLALGAKTQIRGYLSLFKGNFIFYVRNAKGYVTAAIDKLGNFNWYEYDQDGTGDRLISVARYSLEDLDLNGVLEQVATELYHYGYAALRDLPSNIRSPEWSGMLTEVQTDQKPNLLSEVTYANALDRYGMEPVVSSLKIGTMAVDIEYEFEGAKFAKFTDSLERTSFYHFDDLGFVFKVEGPTESSDKEILVERHLNRKNFRVDNEIVRGVENLIHFNANGDLIRLTECADRNNSGTKIDSRIARMINENGETTDLACTAGAAQRVTAINSVHHQEYFYDLTATAQPKEIVLPQSGLISGSRVLTAHGFDCQGNPAGFSLEVGQTVIQSGSVCRFNLEYEGVRMPTLYLQEDFEDGTLKASASIEACLGGSTCNSIAEITGLPMSSWTDQTGHFNNLPHNGWDKVYNPLTGRDEVLNARRIQVQDAYGNSLLEKFRQSAQDPRAAQKLYALSYRGASARLTGIKDEWNAFFISEDQAVENRFADMRTLVDRIIAGRSFANGEIIPFGKLTDEFLQDHSDNSSVNPAYFQRQFVLDERLELPHPSFPLGFIRDRVTSAISSEGSKSTYLYNPVSNLVERITRESRGTDDLSNRNYLTENRILTYDDYERLLTVADWTTAETQSVLVKKSTTLYRDRFDKSVRGQELDSSNRGGGIVRTEIILQDWAGRPLITRETRIGETDAPPVQENEITYNEFGEVARVATRVGTENSSFAIDVKEFERDQGTGTVTVQRSHTRSVSVLPAVDESSSEIQYSQFTPALRPQLVTQTKKDGENGNIISQQKIYSTGVAGKRIDSRLVADAQYGNVSNQQNYSRSVSQWDGCGNLVRVKNYVSSSKILTSQATVEYQNGFCLVSRSVDPLGIVIENGYDKYGTLLVSDTTTAENDGVDGTDFDHTVRDVSFQSSFLKCDRDVHGRCESPGWVQNFSVSGSLMHLNGAEAETFVFTSGEAVYAGIHGLLRKKTFIEGKIHQEIGTIESLFNSRTDKYWGLPTETPKASDLLARTETRKNLFDLKETIKNRNGRVTNTTEIESDFILGDPKFTLSKRMDPATLQIEGSLSVLGKDSIGRSLEAFHFLAPVTFDENSSVPATPTNLASTMSSQNFSEGRPQQVNSGQKSSASWVHGQVSYSNYTYDVPATSVMRKSFNQNGFSYESILTQTQSVDGMGRPMDMVSDVRLTGAAIPGEPLSVGSRRTYQRDFLNRITSESLQIVDSVESGGSVYNVGANTVARDFFDEGGSQTFTLENNYEERPGKNMTTMNYLGFRVEYEKSLTNDNIFFVRVYTPGTLQFPEGRLYTYNMFTPDRVASEGNARGAYEGNFDFGAGRLVQNNGAHGQDWMNLMSLPNPARLQLDNTGAIGFYRDFLSDSSRTTVSAQMDFSDERLLRISGSIPVSPSGGDEDNNYRSKRQVGFSQISTVPVVRSEAQLSNANCDRIELRRHPRFRSEAEVTLTSDAWSQSNFAFDAMGKLVYGKRTYRLDDDGALPKRKSWVLDGKYLSDLSGIIASEERKIVHDELNPQNYFGTPQFMRIVMKRRFNFTNPLAQLNHGSQYLTLGEVIRDSGSAAHLGQDAEDRSESATANQSGFVTYVYGPQGPIMKFTRNTQGEWDRYVYVYDTQGNVRSQQLVSPAGGVDQFRKPPTSYAQYLPFGSSIITQFPENSVTNLVERNSGEVDASLIAYITNAPATYHLAEDPRFFPLENPIGASGQFRNALGVLDSEGGQVDTFTGRTIGIQASDERVCLAQGNLMSQAQAMVSSMTMRRHISDARSFAPSARDMAVEYEAIQDYLKNEANFFDRNLPFLGISRFAAEKSASWYVREKYGSVGDLITTASAVTNFICPLSSLGDNLQSGSSVGAVFDVVDCASSVVSFIPGGAAAKGLSGFSRGIEAGGVALDGVSTARGIYLTISPE